LRILKSLLILVFGMILGVVLVFGGAALYIYKTVGAPGSMGKVETLASKVAPIDWDEEITSKSVLEYIGLAKSTLSNMSEAQVSDIEKVLGMDLLSSKIEEFIGVPQDIVKDSQLKNLGGTISENLTFQMAKEKFQLELDNMRLFNNEEFMNTPLKYSMQNISDYNLDQFIKIVYTSEATPEQPASKPIIQKLGHIPVRQLATQADEVVQDSTIGELVRIDETSAKIMQYLADTKVKDLSQTINEMQLNDMIKIDENSHNILKKLQNLTVAQLSDSSVTTPILESMTVGELVKVEESSPLLLKSLQDTEIKDLGTRLDSLTIAEVYDHPERGPLSIIDPTTTLQDIPTVIAQDMPNASLYALNQAGIFDITEPAKIGGKVRVYNTTMQKAMSAYADAVAGEAAAAVTSKRYLVYLYDDQALYDTEMNNDNPYASNGLVRNIIRHINQTPLLDPYFEVVTVKIDTYLTANGGFYQITDDFLSTIWTGDTRIPDGAELILQQGVHVELLGDPMSEENTYSSCFSVSGLYEHFAYLPGHDLNPLLELCAQSEHATIRVGSNIKIKNRIGGYSYFRNVAAKIETDVVGEGTYAAYNGLPEEQPVIERNLISPSPTELVPDPVAVPNIRIDYIITE